jgi:hypothetical protein
MHQATAHASLPALSLLSPRPLIRGPHNPCTCRAVWSREGVHERSRVTGRLADATRAHETSVSPDERSANECRHDDHRATRPPGAILQPQTPPMRVGGVPGRSAAWPSSVQSVLLGRMVLCLPVPVLFIAWAPRPEAQHPCVIGCKLRAVWCAPCPSFVLQISTSVLFKGTHCRFRTGACRASKS